MLNFTNLVDLVQIFANEYSIPGNTVLILGIHDLKIKKLFEFIECETIFISNTPLPDFDIIADYSDLPFEERSFDIILNFTNEIELFNLLKKNGTILTQSEILNGKGYYTLNNVIYTVL